MSQVWDLIVVGGGPAGSTLAGLAKKYEPAARVLLLEAEPFPRHHAGEAVLPGAMAVLKELGAHAKIEAGDFPRATGAVFVWGEDRKSWDIPFDDPEGECSRQVLRSRYDQILLDHAAGLGAQARLGWRALRAVEEAGRVVGVEAQDEAGARRLLRCGTLADCSGQSGLLCVQRGAASLDARLRNVAGCAYYKGAKWKFSAAGQPEKTKLFVCSVPEGWFWYVPLSADMVSVGLMFNASLEGQDFRTYFLDALERCAEIKPLLAGAALITGVDPRAPEKDFFTAGERPRGDERACGPGWLAAGDAACSLEALLFAGVAMAHLCGRRAAYAWLASRREQDEQFRAMIWSDYDRFCKEGDAPDLKSWTRRVRAVVEAQFPGAGPVRDPRVRRAQTEAARVEIPDSWVPRLVLPVEEQTIFLPVCADGRLRPARRLRVARTSGLGAGGGAADSSRPLSRSCALALALIDGRRSVGQIKRELSRRSPLPRDILDAQALRLIKDLAVLGAVEWDNNRQDLSAARESALKAGDAWGYFRHGEAALRRGESAPAEAALTRAVTWGVPGPWVYALRGEARRRLLRTAEARADLDEALRLCAAPPATETLSRLEALRVEFEAGVERSLIEDRIRLLRGKLRLVAGDPAGAREDAAAALLVNPRQSEALVVRAHAAMALGDMSAAKADMEAAFAIQDAGRTYEWT